MTTSQTPRRVRVSVPATSANLGPGFDCIGLALDLRGEIELSLAEGPPSPPPGRGEQLALNAARQLFRHLGRRAPHLRVQLDGGVPVGRGLGASAVLHVGATLAAATLAGVELNREDLLLLAAELEGHADNAAPAVFGGVQVVVWDAAGLWHLSLPVPANLATVLFIPEFEMPTEESRRLLPESLSRREVVHQTGRVALLVAGLATDRLDVLAAATDDLLHQPARAQLFPAMYDLFEAATGAGALCAYLSGGGSTIAALVRRDEERIVQALAAAAATAGVAGHTRVVALSNHGAAVIEQR